MSSSLRYATLLEAIVKVCIHARVVKEDRFMCSTDKASEQIICQRLLCPALVVSEQEIQLRVIVPEGPLGASLVSMVVAA